MSAVGSSRGVTCRQSGQAEELLVGSRVKPRSYLSAVGPKTEDFSAVVKEHSPFPPRPRAFRFYLGLGKMLIWIEIYKLVMPYPFLLIGFIDFFKNTLVLKSIYVCMLKRGFREAFAYN
ncbi:hypothetical protein EBU95_16580 [bacterium]|nr:hypothetical protein [bacterium]